MASVVKDLVEKALAGGEPPLVEQHRVGHEQRPHDEQRDLEEAAEQAMTWPPQEPWMLHARAFLGLLGPLARGDASVSWLPDLRCAYGLPGQPPVAAPYVGPRRRPKAHSPITVAGPPRTPTAFLVGIAVTREP